MALSEQKFILIERLMRINDQKALKQFEDLLTRAESEMTADESAAAIEKSDIAPLKEFIERNQAWLKKRA